MQRKTSIPGLSSLRLTINGTACWIYQMIPDIRDADMAHG
jgi:hypothetical protein